TSTVLSTSTVSSVTSTTSGLDGCCRSWHCTHTWETAGGLGCSCRHAHSPQFCPCIVKVQNYLSSHSDIPVIRCERLWTEISISFLLFTFVGGLSLHHFTGGSGL
ncbi:hypothetical protein K503DRAFT_862253, partial [Rhizopogon vinicolor AM-OR11-026]